jgi:hypothetical protein
MCVNKGQELVIGGYIPAGKNFDSLIVGYYKKTSSYMSRVRNGVVRVKVFECFQSLEIKTCTFRTCPSAMKGGEVRGLTADKMAECRWLGPQLVAQ